MKKTYLITAVISTILLFLIILSCGKNPTNNDYYDYLQSDPIQEIIVSDSPLKHGDSVLVIAYYPAGCNGFHSLDYELSNDSLFFTHTRRYIYEGKPCAHGPGVDSMYLKIETGFEGPIHFIYTKPDSTTADDIHLLADINGYYEYWQDLPIDTIQVNSGPVYIGGPGFMQVDAKIPEGCNRLDSVYYAFQNDTVTFHINFYFYFDGTACSHGPQNVTVFYIMEDIDPGFYTVRYKKPDGTEVFFEVEFLAGT